MGEFLASWRLPRYAERGDRDKTRPRRLAARSRRPTAIASSFQRLWGDIEGTRCGSSSGKVHAEEHSLASSPPPPPLVLPIQQRRASSSSPFFLCQSENMSAAPVGVTKVPRGGCLCGHLCLELDRAPGMMSRISTPRKARTCQRGESGCRRVESPAASRPATLSLRSSTAACHSVRKCRRVARRRRRHSRRWSPAASRRASSA